MPVWSVCFGGLKKRRDHNAFTPLKGPTNFYLWKAAPFFNLVGAIEQLFWLLGYCVKKASNWGASFSAAFCGVT